MNSQQDKIRTMTTTEGWEMLKEWINKQIEIDILSVKQENLPVKQAEIRTYKNILGWVQEQSE